MRTPTEPVNTGAYNDDTNKEPQRNDEPQEWHDMKTELRCNRRSELTKIRRTTGVP
jgi:hypothetical protein